MKEKLFVLCVIMLNVISCGGEDTLDEGNTGDTGNTGDSGDTGDTGNTGDTGGCPGNDRFCYSHDGLNWSDPSSQVLSYSDAGEYCYNKFGRLPTISELRTLVKNCPATQTGGLCKVDDSCLSQTSCWSDNCLGCEEGKTYSVFEDKGWFWSGSATEEAASHVWRINFDDGNLGAYDVSSANYVRCVEDGNRCPENNKFCYDNDGLKWSDISRKGMSWDDAGKFCEDIDGRLPTISELRTLIQNCSSTETDGECNVTDSCLSYDCGNNNECYGCSGEEIEEFSKLGDFAVLWSSSVVTFVDGEVWHVNFFNASIYSDLRGHLNHFRCIDADICVSEYEVRCYDDDLYWYDSCGNKEGMKESCLLGCENEEECKKDSNERWVDPDTGLSWSIATEDPVVWDGSVDFCNNLGDNWRVPTISELRTLMQNCSGTVTGGECAVTDSCLNSSCYNDECRNCSASFSGYSKIGDMDLFWSSSVNDADNSIAFEISFFDGGIYADSKTTQAQSMCVR